MSGDEYQKNWQWEKKTNSESEPWGIGADLDRVDARWISFFFCGSIGLGANQKKKKNNQQTYIHTYIVSCIPRFTQKRKHSTSIQLGHTDAKDRPRRMWWHRKWTGHLETTQLTPSFQSTRAPKGRTLSKQQSMSPTASRSMSVLWFSRKSITSIHLWTAYILVWLLINIFPQPRTTTNKKKENKWNEPWCRQFFF